MQTNAAIMFWGGPCPIRDLFNHSWSRDPLRPRLSILTQVKWPWKRKTGEGGWDFNSKQIDSTLKLYRFPRVYLYGPRESFVGCLALALVLWRFLIGLEKSDYLSEFSIPSEPNYVFWFLNHVRDWSINFSTRQKHIILSFIQKVCFCLYRKFYCRRIESFAVYAD